MIYCNIQVSGSHIIAGVITPLEEEAKLAAIRAAQRHEAVVKLLTTLLGLGLSLGITYYGVKYLMKAMDPTQHDRLDAMQRVISYCID